MSDQPSDLTKRSSRKETSPFNVRTYNGGQRKIWKKRSWLWSKGYFNRTLKGKMWQAFSEQGSYKWLDLLQNIVKNYNNTCHRTVGMKPIDVNRYNKFLI